MRAALTPVAAPLVELALPFDLLERLGAYSGLLDRGAGSSQFSCLVPALPDRGVAGKFNPPNPPVLLPELIQPKSVSFV